MSDLAPILIVTAERDAWSETASRLAREGLASEVVDLAVAASDLASRAREGSRVIVVDLVPDLDGGLGAVSACRKAAPQAPIVAVAASPSVDLARTIRASGVFYLAIHPVAAAEMRSVVEDALRSIGRGKPTPTCCKTKKTVLIVDDDADYRTSTVALLEGEGYSVRCACSAKEGLECLEAERPDLIILDIMMEDVWAGYGLNQAVKFGDKRQAASGVPILMVSSIEQQPGEIFPTAGEAAMVTPDDYLTKPLDIPVFLEHVRQLLARPGRSE